MGEVSQRASGICGLDHPIKMQKKGRLGRKILNNATLLRDNYIDVIENVLFTHPSLRIITDIQLAAKIVPGPASNGSPTIKS